MDNSQHTEIMVQLGVISTEVKELNRRVGIQNGRVATHDELIAKLASRLDVMDGKRSGISISWGVFIALAGIVIGVLTILARI